ncbi:MAG: phage antirepressor N-terminal domain-containing protein [Candidatus Promineifilaceae bacterium]
MSEKSLTVVDQREVTFYGDNLVAVRATDGQVYVAVRQMCDALGLDRRGQVRRLERQPILAEGYKGGDIMAPPSESGRGGGPQIAGLLRVDLVPLWLAGVDVKRAKEEIRPKLERYQREAAKVLWEAFQQGRLTSPGLDELLSQDTPAVRAYKLALAVVDLARNQVLLEAQLEDHGRRLEAIEAHLGDPGRQITPEQASQLSQAIKAVALALGQKSGRNEYGGVYGELYRRFAITSYKLLPAAKFQAAMAWLAEWHQQTTGAADVPF